ncbi:MAG TPA: hypothetical protein DHI91_02620 [Candidatus Portnoybacteria bacterium]|uniref:Ribulose-phosphate 3-epimerase n=1 Tax=Candidatus Portnoybacteria bacterium CG02_land_8_20_14_3_00_45_8 TaxID=1974807 RepID=A0A2M7D5T4_9BACT|nr:MAG: hypothetical protein COS30_02415 [Candidatus Portnoybacteria bacterium CG02_land_8_20_14_3_00_45_8]HCX28010.1 hypothetical protein [Candidatus Portnoybacteria bacterium]
MAEIIPAIIAKNFENLQDKIKSVEPWVAAVQLDVMDGIFVPNKTWPFNSSREAGLAQGKPSDLENLDTKLFLEAHLMVDAPYRVLNEWLTSKVKRIILHWEALDNPKIKNQNEKPQFKIQNLIKETRNAGKQFGLALNLETPIEVLESYIDDLDLVLLMGVNPGFAGQEFQNEVIPKIKQLRQKYPSVKIEVDGGVGPSNIREVYEAGAELLVVGSAVFGQSDIGQVIKTLESKIKD